MYSASPHVERDHHRPLSPTAPSSALTRREFLRLSALSSLAVCTGCAANPVTGESQLMLMSEEQEVKMDREGAPRGISDGHGRVGDSRLAAYVEGVGKGIYPVAHRPNMPYRFYVLNATSINAWAMTGGTISVNRGALLNMTSEDELAALLGHEIAHVSARHTSARLSHAMLTSILVAAATEYARQEKEAYGMLAGIAGGFAQQAYLAKYSRDNERQADALAMQYILKAGYNPLGHMEMMDMLVGISKDNPSVIERMLSSHPMSRDRYQASVDALATVPAAAKSLPLQRERYMDNTAELRARKEAIEETQKGEHLVIRGDYGEALGHFLTALKQRPDEYPALYLTSYCLLQFGKYKEMEAFARAASQLNPEEPKPFLMLGVAAMQKNDHRTALQHLHRYDRVLPGDPSIHYFLGRSYEQVGNRSNAAGYYGLYLKNVQAGPPAQRAYQRLADWGYLGSQPIPSTDPGWR